MTPQTTSTSQKKKPFWRQQYVLVIAAAALGALVGAVAPKFAVELKPLADIFIALIKTTIAPLIFLVVVTGIAQAGDMRTVGRIGLKAIIYFEIVTSLCLLMSLGVAQWIRPGEGVARATSAQAELTAKYAKAHVGSFTEYILHLFPESFGGAFAGGEVLQVLVLAILTGLALLLLGERGTAVRTSLERFTELVFSIVNIVVLTAPVGAFGAMAFTVGKFGTATLWALGLLVLTAWAMMAFFIVVVLGLICRMVKIKLTDLLRLLRTELLIVFGTSSSETAIPGMMWKLPAAGVARAVTGLVIPSGYSFNLDGVALTLPLSVLFIAQVYGIHLDWQQQLSLFILMLFTSKGAAGITGGAFAALAATVVGSGVVPVEGLALLLGIDRFMSLGRSITNTIGNAVAAVVVARWDGEFDATAWQNRDAAVSKLSLENTR